MAENTIDIAGASQDLQTIEDFVNLPAGSVVNPRLLPSVDVGSLAGIRDAIFEAGGLPATPFATKALMTASALVDDSYAMVTEDTVNNGLYVKEAGAWVKSSYDPLLQANKYTDDKVSVQFNNVLNNGDFAETGTNYWKSGNATLSKNNNNLVITLTGSEKDGYARQAATLINGHEYLIKARFKVDSANCTKVEIGHSSNFAGGYLEYSNPAASEWIDVSAVKQARSELANFSIIHTYADATTAANKQLTVDFISLIDLTSAFPEGIPSQEVLDSIFTNTAAPYSMGIEQLIFDKMYPAQKDALNNNLSLTEDDKTITDTKVLYKDGNLSYGAVEGPDGNITTALSLYQHTGFIDVSLYKSITLSDFAYDTFAYAFYDAEYKPIFFGDPTSADYVLNGTINVPDGAKYFVRSMVVSGRENGNLTRIVGSYAGDKLGLYAKKRDALALSNSAKSETVKTQISSALFEQDGEYSDSGVINIDTEHRHTGLLNVSDYDAVILSGFTSVYLKRFWLDENYNIVRKFDYTADKTKYVLNGYYQKPTGAKYFVANLKDTMSSDEAGIIHGERQLNTSDFQRKGGSGDATTGFEIAGDRAKTYKSIDLYSENFPTLNPLRIYNSGQRPNYAYNEDYLTFTTEIYREAWGLQITMNLEKTKYPENLYPTKNVLGVNGLLQEWGAEGFSWHICPPGFEYGERAWMAFKIGGDSPRSNTEYSFKHGSMAQFFTPTWTERIDGTRGGAWAENTTDPSHDETIPTRTNLRQSTHFISPELYQCAYSDNPSAMWEHYVRCRGTLKAPAAAINGDSVHRQDFSVCTGVDVDGNPTTKKVAQIEIVYADDGSDNEAYIVFKTWNKITQDWEEKLKL